MGVLIAICVLLLSIYFLFKNNKAFRFFLTYQFYGCCIGTAHSFCIPYCLLHPKNYKNLRFIAAITRSVISLVWGIKFDIQNGELLASETPCILVSNHQAPFDSLGLFTLCKYIKRCRMTMAGNLYLEHPVFSLTHWLAGAIFLPLTDTGKAVQALDRVAQEVIATNAKLNIRPEGRLFNDGTIHPFKKGAFHLAVKYQLDIVPMVYSRYKFYNYDEKKFERGTPTTICVLPPMPTKGLTAKDVDSLTEAVHKVMVQKFQELNANSN